MSPHYKIIPIFLLLLFCLFPRPVLATRTVTQYERALVWASPYNGDYSEIGAFLGVVGSSAFSKLPADAIKMPHALCQHIQRLDNSNLQGHFPYSKLKAYNDAEVKAGRDPIFVTATYQGKERPVVFTIWSDHSENERMYAVNAADERYIDFYINEFLKKIVFPGASSVSGKWIHCDTGMFSYGYYGVFNDAGNYVSGVKWDEPFPQNQQEFQTMIKTFFKRIKEKSGINIMVNRGGIPTEYMEYIWSEIPGSLHERSFDYEKTSTYDRDKWYEKFQFWEMMRRDNKPVVFYTRAQERSNAEKIRTYFIAYLIVRGDNFFYAPKSDLSGSKDLAPSYYEPIRDAVGPAVAEPQSEQRGSSKGRRVYWRKMQKGMIYLNYTGSTQTIQLPSDRTYRNRSGQVVTSITLADMRGDYVTSSSSPPTKPPAPTAAPTTAPGLGDSDGDGDVDGVDYMTWKSHYNSSTTSGPSVGDFDSNQTVDGIDYMIWKANYTG